MHHFIKYINIIYLMKLHMNVLYFLDEYFIYNNIL